MSGIYSFRAGPVYRGAAPEEQFLAAMEQPLSLGSTLWDQAKGGVMESFGLGTAIRDFTTPQGNPEERSFLEKTARQLNWFTNTYDLARGLKARTEPESPALNEEAYKNSAYFREGIQWDQSMTEDRAAALAILYDTKKVREFYAQKRPITSFIGNLAGQAVDPINYIPVAGPTVRAASVARYGRVAGEAAVASLDAAANTALFGLATAEERAKYGDDVSWQATVSQIAMAALIGSAFGTLGGAIGARTDARAVSAVEERLSTLQATQEARVALNESIGSIAQGEDISLSPTAVAYIEEMASRGIPDEYLSDQTGGQLAAAYTTSADMAYLGVPREPTRLAEFLRRRGGIVDEGGDVRAIIGSVKGRPGLISGRGATLDDAALAAYEAGYFPELGGERPTPRQLLDKLDEDMRGNAQYSAADQAEASAFTETAAWNRQIDELGAEYGINPKGMSRAEFFDRIAESRSVEDLAADVQSRADADAAAFAEAERAAKDASLDAAELYDIGEARSLADLENEYRQEIASGNALEGEIRTGEAGPAGSGAGQVSGRAASRRDYAVDAGRGNAQDPSAPGYEELNSAQSRLTKPENYKALAEQYKVDPETGSFVEEGDIAQLDTEGRLTAEDKSVIADAQKAYEDGTAYGEALKAAVSCLV